MSEPVLPTKEDQKWIDECIAEINNLRHEVSNCESRIADRTKELQSRCQHRVNEVVEGDYKAYDYSTDPPFRVCTVCGYAEQGWGCGYWKLNYGSREIPTIPRSEAQKYIRKFFTQDQMNELRYGRR